MEQISFKLNVFEGPLDLLLHLVQKNKVSLYDIPMAQITGQYLAYLKEMQELDLPLTSDFLVMAATLLQIKSRMLLPKNPLEEDEEDPRMELVTKLAEYQQYKDSLAYFERRLQEGSRIHTREPEPFTKNTVPYDGIEGDLSALTEAFFRLLQKKEEQKPPEKKAFDPIIARRMYSVEEKKEWVLTKLKTGKTVLFLELFSSAMERGEMVASFLAVLELVKESTLRVEFGRGPEEIRLVYAGGE